MKFYLALLFSLIVVCFLNAQTSKVAILDFENTSGKPEYDALGKAISSMLITDLANNIDQKKVEFFERSQLNKLLDEQNLQKNKSFDTNTAVEFGKLSGVNYVFIGSVFIMDGTCNFSSKLVDVQTSKILLAKEVNGKIESWLMLKSELAEAIANQLNNPITLESSIKNEKTTLATINQFSKILSLIDKGDFEGAEKLSTILEETNPEFIYFKTIENDIQKLKEKIRELKSDIDGSIENPFKLAFIKFNEKNYSHAEKIYKLSARKILKNDPLIVNKLSFNFYMIAQCNFELNNFEEAIKYCDSSLLINKEFYKPLFLKLEILLKQSKNYEANHMSQKIISSWSERYTLNNGSSYFYYTEDLIATLDFIKKGYGDWKKNDDFISFKNKLTYQLEYIENEEALYLNFYDGYENYDFRISDYFFKNKLDLIILLSDYYTKYKTEFNLDELEYIKIKANLMSLNPDFKLVLLGNSKWILDYFYLINSISWKKIKFNKLNEAKNILLENIILLANLDINKYNKEIGEKYCLPEKKLLLNHLVENKKFTTIPHEAMPHLLTNLGIYYFLTKEFEKSKQIFSILKETKNDYSGYTCARICGFKINIANKTRNGYIDFSNLFIEKLANLDLNHKGNETFFDSEQTNLEKGFILLDEHNEEKLTYKLCHEDYSKEYVNYIEDINLLWQSENLDVDTFRNGDKIFFSNNALDWKDAIVKKKPAYCYYNFDQNNSKYGKLYNHFAAIDPRNIAPIGWKVPNDDEWEIFIDSLGHSNAGKIIKSESDWNLKDNLNNFINFNALPSGWIDERGYFSGKSNFGYFWSLSDDNKGSYIRYISNVSNQIERYLPTDKYGCSIRCIKIK